MCEMDIGGRQLSFEINRSIKPTAKLGKNFIRDESKRIKKKLSTM